MNDVELMQLRKARSVLFESILRPSTLRLLNIARVHRGATVVDLGCGCGAVTFLLCRMVGPSGRVYAIDRNRDALDQLQVDAAKAGYSNIILVYGDAEQALHQVPSADFVYCRFFLMHLSRHDVVLAKIRKTLIPDGRFIIEEPIVSKTTECPSVGLWAPGIALYEAMCRLQRVDPNFGCRVRHLVVGAGFMIDKIHESQTTLSPPTARDYIFYTLMSAKDLYLRSGVVNERDFDLLTETIRNFDLSKIYHCSYHTVVQAICTLL